MQIISNLLTDLIELAPSSEDTYLAWAKIIFSLILSKFFLVLFFHTNNLFFAFFLILFIAASTSNSIDRLFFPEVRDYWKIDLFNYSIYFNLADLILWTSIVVILLFIVIKKIKTRKKHEV